MTSPGLPALFPAGDSWLIIAEKEPSDSAVARRLAMELYPKLFGSLHQGHDPDFNRREAMEPGSAFFAVEGNFSLDIT